MARRRRYGQSDEPDVTKIPMLAPPKVGAEVQDDLGSEELDDMPAPDMVNKVHQGMQDLQFDENEYSKMLQHPKLPEDTLRAAYDRFFPEPAEDVDAGEATPDGHLATKMIESILKNPNLPKDIAEKHFERSHRVDENASNNKHITDQHIEQAIKDSLDKGNKLNIKRSEDQHPDFYHSLLANREIPEPETDTMTESQREHNLKVDAIDQTVLKGLSGTSKHTPETLKRAIDFLTGEKPFGMSDSDSQDALTELIQKNPNMSSEDLERLNALPVNGEEANRWGKGRSRKEAILAHPNTPPAIIAAAAMDSESNIQGEAMKSPRLPEETRKRLVEAVHGDPENWEAKRIVQNPNLDTADLKRLYSTGDQRIQDDVISHPNVPEEVVRQYFDDHKDKLDAARHLVSKGVKVPKDVLIGLVNHKNQEVAESALNHPNADLDVINAGLKRKAAKVKQAAMRHPLVAGQELMKGLQSEKITGYDFLQPANMRALNNQIPPEAAKVINERYSMKKYDDLQGADPSLATTTNVAEDKQKFWSVKEYLANHSSVPADIRNQNIKDITSHFLAVTKPNDTTRQNQSYRTDVKSQLSSYVADLAEQGDQAAQESLLQRPGFMKQVDLKSDAFGTDFLNKAYDAIHQNAVEGKYIGDDYPNSPVGMEPDLHKMVQNPNVSQEVFDKITLAPDFLSHKGNFYPDRSSYGYNSEHKKTIFDKKYEHLDENQRRQAFQKLMATGDLGTKATIYSLSVPHDTWRQAFSQADSERRKEFLEQHDVSAYADPQTFKEALLGEYNKAGNLSGSRYNIKAPQLDAIKSLDKNDEGDVALAQQTVDNYLSHIGDRNQPKRNDLAYSFPQEILGDPAISKDLIKRAYSWDSTQQLGALLAVQAASFQKEPQDKLNSLITHLNDTSLIGDPEEVDAVLSRRWGTLLSNIDGTTEYGRTESKAGDMLKHIARGDNYSSGDKPANGSLDFLADMGDPSEFGIATMAIQKNLLSPEAVARVGQRDPKALVAGLARMSHSARANVLGQLVDNNQLTPELMSGIIPSLNSGIFTSKRYGDKFNDQMYENTKNRIFKFADSLALQDPESAASALAITVGTDPSDKKDRMPIDYKKRLLKDYVAHLNSQALPDATRFDIMQHLNAKLDKWDASQYAPADLQKLVVNAAVKDNNLEAIKAMLYSGNAPSSVISSVADMYTEPGKLDAEQMVVFGRALTGRASLASTRKMVTGMMDMISSGQAMQHEQQLKMHIATGADKALSNPEISLKDTKYYSSIALSLLSDNIGSYHRYALDALQGACLNDSIPSDEKARIFKSIPDESFSFTHMFRNNKDIDFLNSPETILAATGGNKLKAVMDAGMNLKPNVVDTVTNRVFHLLETGDLDHNALGDYASELLHNPSLTQDQALKVFRAVPILKQYDVLRLASGSVRNKPVILTALGMLVDDSGMALRQTSGTLDGHILVPGSEQHIYSVKTRLLSIAESLSDVLESNTLTATDKNDYSESFDTYLDHLNGFAEMGHNALGDLKDLSDMPDHVQVNPLRPVEVMLRGAPKDFASYDQLKKIMKIGAVSGKIHDEYLRLGQAATYGTILLSDVATAHINKFKMSDDEMAESVQLNPEMIYAFSRKTNVPTSLFKHVNLKDMLLKDGNFAANLQSMAKNLKVTDPSELKKLSDDTVGSLTIIPEHKRDGMRGALSYMIDKSPSTYSFNDLKRYTKALKSNNINNGQLAQFVKDAVAVGAGGSDFVKYAIRGEDVKLDSADLIDLSQTANLDVESTKTLLHKDEYSGYDVNRLLALSSNTKLGSESLGLVVAEVKEHMDAPAYQIKKAAEQLTRNPNVSLPDLTTLYDATKKNYGTEFKVGEKFHPAFLNPKHGGDLFRSLPVQLPKKIIDYKVVNPETLVTNASYSLSRNRLKQALAVIPTTGITWAQFKKANPKLENLPEVKQMFMEKNNRPIMPEDVMESIQKADASEFHVTYTKWDGAQRHRAGQKEDSNLVMQFNTSKSMEQKLASNPKQLEFFKFVQDAANHTANAEGSGHPVTPHIGGWLRADVGGGKEGWIIEELQSDFGQRMHQEIESLARHYPEGRQFGQYMITPEEMHEFTDNIADILSGWQQSAFSAIEELAKKNGVQNLYMHGLEPRAQLSGFDKGKEYPVYIKETYDKYPKNNGWESVDYNDYPVKSQKFQKELANRKNSLCWKKKL